MRTPFTQVPLSDPRSSISSASPTGRIAACRREISGSSIVTSASTRPTTSSVSTGTRCPASGPSFMIREGTKTSSPLAGELLDRVQAELLADLRPALAEKVLERRPPAREDRRRAPGLRRRAEHVHVVVAAALLVRPGDDVVPRLVDEAEAPAAELAGRMHPELHACRIRAALREPTALGARQDLVVGGEQRLRARIERELERV